MASTADYSGYVQHEGKGYRATNESFRPKRALGIDLSQEGGSEALP